MSNGNIIAFATLATLPYLKELKKHDEKDLHLHTEIEMPIFQNNGYMYNIQEAKVEKHYAVVELATYLLNR